MTYTLDDIRRAEVTLTPCKCKSCGSLETVYLQGVDALSCQECGEMEE
jgi:ribosomal protein S27E